MLGIIAENIKDMKQVLLRVANLEQDESIVNSSTIEGYNASQALDGYAALCELYLYSRSEGLNKDEKEKLLKLIKDFRALVRESDIDNKLAMEMVNHVVKTKPKDQIKESEIPDEIRRKIKKKSDHQARELLVNGRLPLRHGFTISLSFKNGGKLSTEPGHHALAEIRYEGDKRGTGKYRMVIYNAGFG